MITVISGTNRPGSNTRKIAQLALESLRASGADVELLDLADLPIEIFEGSAYAEKPASFEPFQDAVLATEGIVAVIPEYNGAYPGG
jgi:NAD(P)H-dependent FMN reductase